MIAPSMTGARSAQAPVDMQRPSSARSGTGSSISSRIAWRALRPVRWSRDESPADVRRAFAAEQTLPAAGRDAAAAARGNHRDCCSTTRCSTAHPRFFGYITSSPAPIGMLGDFLAAALNQNVGAWRLAPLATEIEEQTVRWIAELIGFPAGCGGLLVSGGNMANFVGVVAARAAKAAANISGAWGCRAADRACCLHVDRDPHLGSEGSRPVRARHRRDPLDCDR